MDQSTSDMEVVGGTQESSIRCNWKGLAENSIDIYHGPGTHPSYIDYLISASGVTPDLGTPQGHVSPLGNGHSVAEYNGLGVGRSRTGSRHSAMRSEPKSRKRPARSRPGWAPNGHSV